MVQVTSNKVECVKFSGLGWSSLLYNVKHLNNNQEVNITIATIKNIIILWKFNIPSI